MPRSLTTAAASLALAVLRALAGVAVAVTPASATADTITSVMDSPGDKPGGRVRPGPRVTSHPSDLTPERRGVESPRAAVH